MSNLDKLIHQLKERDVLTDIDTLRAEGVTNDDVILTYLIDVIHELEDMIKVDEMYERLSGDLQ